MLWKVLCDKSVPLIAHVTTAINSPTLVYRGDEKPEDALLTLNNF